VGGGGGQILLNEKVEEIVRFKIQSKGVVKGGLVGGGVVGGGVVVVLSVGMGRGG